MLRCTALAVSLLALTCSAFADDCAVEKPHLLTAIEQWHQSEAIISAETDKALAAANAGRLDKARLIHDQRAQHVVAGINQLLQMHLSASRLQAVKGNCGLDPALLADTIKYSIAMAPKLGATLAASTKGTAPKSLDEPSPAGQP